MNFSSLEKCYIIAEIGGNFVDYDTAVRLIDDAYESGVDAIKLQTYRGETMVDGSAVFDMESISGVLQKDYFKKFEIDEENHKKIFEYAKSKGLDIFSTPSHITDVEMLERLGCCCYKIGADDATNYPFLEKVAQIGKPVLLSTGMCTMDEVRKAVETIVNTGNKDVVVMHVVSLYPTPKEKANLNVIKTLASEFPDITIGYSDHTMTTEGCLYAAVLGAKVIEKHFTYDKNADGPDHMHSATKDEMKQLISDIRTFELMSGDGVKAPQGDENKNRINNRKSIITCADVKKGEAFSEENLDIKRPGKGLEPKYYNDIIGKKAKRDIVSDTLISWEDIE